MDKWLKKSIKVDDDESPNNQKKKKNQVNQNKSVKAKKSSEKV